MSNCVITNNINYDRKMFKTIYLMMCTNEHICISYWEAVLQCLPIKNKNPQHLINLVTFNKFSKEAGI